MRTYADPTQGSTVDAFLDALGRRDATTIRALFAPDVWVRALLVRHVVGAENAEEATDLVTSWVAGRGLRVLDVHHETIAGRERLGYRLLVQPEWAPDTWHLIEQTGFAKVVNGRVTRLDLACSGYWPVSEPGGEPDESPIPAAMQLST